MKIVLKTIIFGLVVNSIAAMDSDTENDLLFHQKSIDLMQSFSQWRNAQNCQQGLPVKKIKIIEETGLYNLYDNERVMRADQTEHHYDPAVAEHDMQQHFSVNKADQSISDSEQEESDSAASLSMPESEDSLEISKKKKRSTKKGFSIATQTIVSNDAVLLSNKGRYFNLYTQGEEIIAACKNGLCTYQSKPQKNIDTIGSCMRTHLKIHARSKKNVSTFIKKDLTPAQLFFNALLMSKNPQLLAKDILKSDFYEKDGTFFAVCKMKAKNKNLVCNKLTIVKKIDKLQCYVKAHLAKKHKMSKRDIQKLPSQINTLESEK